MHEVTLELMSADAKLDLLKEYANYLEDEIKKLSPCKTAMEQCLLEVIKTVSGLIKNDSIDEMAEIISYVKDGL